MTAEAQRIKELERQNKELLCANNMEATASAFFVRAKIERTLKSYKRLT